MLIPASNYVASLLHSTKSKTKTLLFTLIIIPSIYCSTPKSPTNGELVQNDHVLAVSGTLTETENEDYLYTLQEACNDALERIAAAQSLPTLAHALTSLGQAQTMLLFALSPLTDGSELLKAVNSINENLAQIYRKWEEEYRIADSFLSISPSSNAQSIATSPTGMLKETAETNLSHPPHSKAKKIFTFGVVE